MTSKTAWAWARWKCCCRKRRYAERPPKLEASPQEWDKSSHCRNSDAEADVECAAAGVDANLFVEQGPLCEPGQAKPSCSRPEQEAQPQDLKNSLPYRSSCADADVKSAAEEDVEKKVARSSLKFQEKSDVHADPFSEQGSLCELGQAKSNCNPLGEDFKVCLGSTSDQAQNTHGNQLHAASSAISTGLGHNTREEVFVAERQPVVKPWWDISTDTAPDDKSEGACHAPSSLNTGSIGMYSCESLKTQDHEFDANKSSTAAPTDDGNPKVNGSTSSTPVLGQDSRTPIGEESQSFGVTLLGYRCPHCGCLVASFNEAIAHCRVDAGRSAVTEDGLPWTACKPEQAGQTLWHHGRQLSTSEFQSAEANRSNSAPSGCGSATGCKNDTSGQQSAPGSQVPELQAHLSPRQEPTDQSNSHHRFMPSITRVIEAGTGKAHTLVQTADGSQCAFGEQTVASLLRSTVEDCKQWVGTLAREELHGLVHEMGQRLMSSSRSYMQEASEQRHLDEVANEEYFGLEETSTERDLDNAYRTLARRLHPDKNGGTEESKELFQELQTRYDALKSSWHDRGSGKANQKGASICYDPGDRESLEQTLWKMLEQLRVLEQGRAAAASVRKTSTA